jgi:hypothetical protein
MCRETGGQNQAFDGFMGLRIDQHYTGVVQDDGTVLVAVVGEIAGSDVRASSERDCLGIRPSKLESYCHDICSTQRKY